MDEEELNVLDILNRFDDYEDLNPEFRYIISARLNAMLTAMLHVSNDVDLVVDNPNGDVWCEEYNRCAELYQKYHNKIEEE